MIKQFLTRKRSRSGGSISRFMPTLNFRYGSCWCSQKIMCNSADDSKGIKQACSGGRRAPHCPRPRPSAPSVRTPRRTERAKAAKEGQLLARSLARSPALLPRGTDDGRRGGHVRSTTATSDDFCGRKNVAAAPLRPSAVRPLARSVSSTQIASDRA